MKDVHGKVLLAAVGWCVWACGGQNGSEGSQAGGASGWRPITGLTTPGSGGSTSSGAVGSSAAGASNGLGVSTAPGSTSTGAGGSATSGGAGDATRGLPDGGSAVGAGASNGPGGSDGTTAATSTDGGSHGDSGAGVSGGGEPGPAPTTASTDGGGATGTNEDSEFQACVKGLKAKCPYDEPESACSSLMTAEIPLTGGKTSGNIELPQGPYGSYVEWNEGSAFATPSNLLEATCAIAAASFGEPQSVTDDVLDLRGQELTLYTMFRPACMKKSETYPVITWGNGTCGQSGGYAALLATVASYGFVVIAPNSRWTDQGNNEMLKALDLAKAENEKQGSVLYQKLDLSKVGAMGHSQGGSATVHAATDSRIKAVILWNGGTSASKPFLAVSGDRDIGGRSATQLASAVTGAAQPGGWLYYHQVLSTGGSMTGHLTLMEQPERAAGPAVAWWKYMLQGDPEARKMFVGTDCGLCSKKDEYEFGEHNLP